MNNNYPGQALGKPRKPYLHSKGKSLEYSAAVYIREKIETEPTGEFGAFIIDAAANDGTILLQKHGDQFLDYTELAGRAWQDLVSENPAISAYGQILCRSLGITVDCDGR